MKLSNIKTQSHNLRTTLLTLDAVCRQYSITAEAMVFGAYCLLLYRKTGDPAYVLGYVSGTEILPIPVQLDSHIPAMEAVKQIGETHSARLSSSSQDSISRSFAALFGGPGSRKQLQNNLASGHIAVLFDTPKNNQTPKDTALTYTLTYMYDQEFFTDGQIRIHHLQLETLLADILENPDKPVHTLAVISAYEHTLIRQANDTDIPFSETRAIHECVEEMAARQPDAPALRFCHEELSYAAFDRMTNRLAQTLSAMGASPGTFVAIAAGRGIELITAMFAVLKTGAAYVPLSLLYPPEYLSMLLRHCGAPLLLTTAPEATAALANSVRIVDLRSAGMYAAEDHRLPRAPGFSPQSPAALVYTSGTTGQPKGVIIRHDTVVNYCEYNLREFHINADDNIMQFAPFPFSTSILEIATTLMGGAKLCLVPDQAVMDPAAFYKEMIAAEATILLAPPEYVGYLPLPPTLRVVETGASECRREVAEKIIRTTRHVNAYGLTEGSVPTVWQGCGGAPPRRIPIGKPVANTRVYILDSHGQECGAYMPGELCITGLAVSDGYLNDPELTDRRFVPNPFGTGIMLRTGDIAQWNADADIEYIGRADNQVQVRGMRVELEEVERALSQIPIVAGTAAVARPAPNGDTQIIAFITSAHGADKQPASLDPETIRMELYNHLLEHKVPSVIVCLDKMPLTPNGKVDKRALTAMDILSADSSAPQNAEEELIANVFSEILKVSNVGTQTNFFALGGHSLRAAQAANLLEKLSGVRIPLKQWFKTPTVGELAQVLRDTLAHETTDNTGKTAQPYAGSTAYTIPSAEDRPAYPMSSAQRRLYLACQRDDTGTAYNIPVALTFSGLLDIDRVRAALLALARRHDILRTRFQIDSSPAAQPQPDTPFMQHITPPGDFSVPLDTVPFGSEDTPESLLADFVRPFDLSLAPLLRARVAAAADGTRSALLVDIHHIISDGTTMYLLLAEFNALYNGTPLPEPPLQYKDFSQWAPTRNLSEQKNHWISVFSQPVPTLDLITDFPRRRRSCKGDETDILTSPALRTEIETLADSRTATPFMIMLASLMVLLSKYGRQEDITVGSPVAGRVHRDLEHTAGMFVNTVALRGRPAREKDFSSFLNEIRQTCLLAFDNQEYPFEELTEALNLPPDPTRNPLFDVLLTMQNNTPYSPQLDGLDFLGAVQNPESAKFDLAFDITEEGNSYRIKLIYSTALFRRESALNLLHHYVALLNKIVSDPSQTLGSITL